MEFTVNTNYGTKHCTCSKGQYGNNHIAIQLYCEESLFATLTINVPGIEAFPENYSCIDTHNHPWVQKFVEKHGIGTFTGTYLHSRYCTYPVYEFNI